MFSKTPFIEIVIFVAGIAAAIAAGFYGYETVGLYGDGPFASGYYRERDPKTGETVLMHKSETSQGRIVRIMDDKLHLHEVRVDSNRDGVDDADVKVTDAIITGTGFSLANDGVIDAWAYRNAAGELVRIEVSTKRNGKIDRWEYYSYNRMYKVDLDTDGNGKPDRWQTYEDGILVNTIIDANEDGKPDAPER